MDNASQTVLERAPAPAAPSPLAQPKRKLAPAKPQTNRQERLISTAYLAMIALIVAFLVVTGLVAWLTA
jgi:hypothetical protein